MFVGISDKRDPTDGTDTFGGDAVAVGSAFWCVPLQLPGQRACKHALTQAHHWLLISYAAYTTMIRWFLPDEDAVSMPLFFGMPIFQSCLLLCFRLGVCVWL